jgi:toxin CcdB
MHQYAICRINPRRGEKKQRWVVILQSDHVSVLRTRLVAPLMEPHEIKRVSRLHPVVPLASQTLILVTEQMATVDVADLGPAQGTAEHLRYEITAALDLLFLGI